MDENLENVNEDNPPFLSSWNKIYALVLGELIILVVLFYFFSKVFS